MTYLYKSTTGTTVNIGSYVISIFGLELDEKVAEIEAEVGISLSRDPEVAEKPESPKAPKVTLLTVPEGK